MAVIRLTRQPDGPVAAVAAVAPPAVRAGSLAREGWQDLLDGRYADALPKAQQALALRAQLFGSEHLEVAASLNVLGEVYRAQGRLGSCESEHVVALAELELIGGLVDLSGGEQARLGHQRLEGRQPDLVIREGPAAGLR